MLEDAEKLMKEGSSFVLRNHFVEAADCYSRALDIRVAHFGELALESFSPYYKYGCALLYKSDDILDSMLKEEEGFLYTGVIFMDSMIMEEEGSHLVSNEEAYHFESCTTCIFGYAEKDRSSVAEE